MSNDYHGRYLTPDGGWDVGPAEDPPASIPARPYPGERTPSLGEAESTLVEQAPVVDFRKPGLGIVSIEEARSWGIEPPFAVALADQLARLGARLDDADFAAAHDSVVRPEIADAIQAAADERQAAVVTFMNAPSWENPTCTECGEVTPCGPRCLDRAAAELHRAVVLTEATERAPKWMSKHNAFYRRLTVDKRRSIVGRIWRRLRRWTR